MLIATPETTSCTPLFLSPTPHCAAGTTIRYFPARPLTPCEPDGPLPCSCLFSCLVVDESWPHCLVQQQHLTMAGGKSPDPFATNLMCPSGVIVKSKTKSRSASEGFPTPRCSFNWFPTQHDDILHPSHQRLCQANGENTGIVKTSSEQHAH